ncbi:hypothetical protein K8S19_09025 [bacterium]|nr:hypothetical protein [bacterium]
MKKNGISGFTASRKGSGSEQRNPEKQLSKGAAFQVPQGGLRVFAYLLSLFPPCGFLLGIIFFSQSEQEAGHFGRVCMIYAGVGLLGLFFCWGVAGIMQGLTSTGPSGGLVGGYY